MSSRFLDRCLPFPQQVVAERDKPNQEQGNEVTIDHPFGSEEPMARLRLVKGLGKALDDKYPTGMQTHAGPQVAGV